MERNVLCKKEEILPGGTKQFHIRKLSIAVVRKGDQFYAVNDRCPHQGASLAKGRLGGAATSNGVGEYGLEKQGEILNCPWHHWKFDVTTGCSLHDPEKSKVKAFEVKVEGDEVVLYTGQRNS